MKKLLTLIVIALCLAAAGCSKKVDKEALLEKINSGAELTQEDYSDMIIVLDENLNLLKAQQDEMQHNPWTPEQNVLITETFTLIGKLDKASRSEELSPEVEEQLQKLHEKHEGKE